MKKLFTYSWIPVLVLALTSISFASCSNDDDNGIPTPLEATAVDLGLSVKWASCNVGATNLEDCGSFFAWGETEEKSEYSDQTYKYGSIVGDYSKYNSTDRKNTLDPEDDVATIKWGGAWRMPTSLEVEELLTSCIWTWTTQNGVNGWVAKGPNENSIFLPTTGSYEDDEIYDKSSDLYLWTSTVSSGSNYKLADILGFDGKNDDGRIYQNQRNFGLPVRPVCE